HAVGTRQRRHAPTLAANGAGDEIEAAHPQVRHDCPHLRQVADVRIAALRLAAEDAQASGARRQEAEDRTHQRRLAGTVRTENADELAAADGETGIRQYIAAADGERRVV